MARQEEERELEYGVRYPNGNTEWTNGGRSFLNVSTVLDRELFERDREAALQKLGIEGAPRVTFLQRYRVTTFTDPREVVDTVLDRQLAQF